VFLWHFHACYVTRLVHQPEGLMVGYELQLSSLSGFAKYAACFIVQDFAAPREIVWLNGAPGSGKVRKGCSGCSRRD
jgi:hypothetical protein